MTTTTGSDTGGSPLIASDRVEGTAVRRRDGETVGTITRLMIEKVSGRVAYAVIGFGGFLGIGEGHATVPWHLLRYDTGLDAYALDLTDAQLRDAPRRAGDGDPSFDAEWEAHVRRYFNAPPHPGEDLPSATEETRVR